MSEVVFWKMSLVDRRTKAEIFCHDSDCLFQPCVCVVVHKKQHMNMIIRPKMQFSSEAKNCVTLTFFITEAFIEVHRQNNNTTL